MSETDYKAGLINSVFSKWETQLRKWYGHGLPSSYLAWDTETTGFSIQYDLPVEFGWCLVAEHDISHRGSYYLDWTLYPELVEPGWLRSRLEDIRVSMASQGRNWTITPQVLHQYGRDPFWVIKFAYDLFSQMRAMDWPFVGHNIIACDNVRWRYTFQEFLQQDWQWKKKEIFDTGALEKALGSLELDRADFRLYPQPGELLADFFVRVQRANRKGVKWNMEHCVRKYQLCERFGLCPEQLHGAEADAYACHLLLEMHREEANDAS